MMEDRQREGGGLAGAGLGDADDVAAGENDRNVCAWIGVGVSYFSSVSARRMGSARPKSLNAVNAESFYDSRRPCRVAMRRSVSRMV